MYHINLGLVMAVIFSVTFANAQAQQNVLAIVGNKKITTEEFKKRYDEIKQKTINAPEARVFLEDLIRYEIGLQQAKIENIEKDPMYIERMNQELYKVLLERKLGASVEKIKVSESDMVSYYKKNPEIRTRHILIEFKADAKPEEKAIAKKRGQEILDKVKVSKRPFEELVKLYTDDTLSKQSGGDIGYQSRVTVVPPYYEAALKMKDGEVRGLIETRYGFHIIKRIDTRSYSQANKQQVRAAVYDEKRRELFDAYFKNLKRKYKIRVNDELIEKFE